MLSFPREMFNMLFLEVIVITFQFVSAVIAVQSGTLAFLQAGTNVSMLNIWENQTLTDSTNVYRHLLPFGQLLNDTHFRSPLIDKWDDLEVIRAKLIFYNSEKEYMGHYLFERSNPGDMDVDFLNTENLVNNKKLVADTNLTYGPAVYIHKSGNEAFFSFMSINMAANLSSVSGNQFIISAHGDLNYLTNSGGKAERISCSSIPVSDDYIYIHSVFECTYYCLTVKHCRYYGIFSMKNSSLAETQHVCVPLPGNPAQKMDECTALCDDDGRCGRTYLDNFPVLATADVYSMVPYVTEAIADMEDGSISDVTGEFFIEDDSSVDLGDLEYIRGIRVEGPGLFTLLLFSGSCETLFDDDFQNEEDRYHGFHTGTVKNFEAAITYNFAPVLARCLYFNSTKNLKDHIVKVAMVTSKFLLAEYMTVHAEWNKAECGDLEVMSRRDIIPDSAIDIHQIAHDVVDFANGSVYPVPAVSYGVVDIHLDDIKETWIESLSIWASVAVAVKIDISTERGCTDQIRGYAHNMSIIGEINTEVPANTLTAERFTLLKRSGFTTFCGENITTIISAVDPTAVAIFTFTLQLYGCVLDAGQSTSNCTIRNLFETYNAFAKGWLEPRPILAYDALRPGGGGLMLGDISNDVFITVRLSQHVNIPVRRVILSGTIFAATAEVDGQLEFGSAYDSNDIRIEFTNVRGDYVRIFDIHRDKSVDTPYLNISVEIYACIIITQGKASTSVTPSFTSLLPVNRNTTSTPTVSPSIETDGSGDYHATDATTIAPTPVDNSVTTTTKRPDDNLTTTTTQQADVNSVTTTTQQPNYNSATSVTQSQDTTTTQGHVSPTTQGQVNPNTQGQVNPNIQGQVSPITQGQVTPTTQGQVNPNTQGQANPITQGQVSPTTQGQVNPNTQGQVSPTTQGQVNPTTQNQNSESVTQTTRQVGNLHTTIVPSQSCTCTNLTRNITQEELDIIVKELIRNLTVPATETSAYKRTKMSMPDERRSSAVIGAVGITSMVTVTGVVIAMDAAHILNAYNFIKSLLSRN